LKVERKVVAAPSSFLPPLTSPSPLFAPANDVDGALGARAIKLGGPLGAHPRSEPRLDEAGKRELDKDGDDGGGRGRQSQALVIVVHLEPGKKANKPDPDRDSLPSDDG